MMISADICLIATESHLETLDDEVLIQKHLQKHRNTVFSILYDRYHHLIYLKCISILKNEHEAKDLMHDVFINIFTKIKQFEGRSKFSLWVHSISTNTCLMYLRRKKRLVLESENNSIDIPDQSGEEVMLAELKWNQLEQLLDQITPHQRLLLIMKYVDDMTIREMSSILKISESAVKMRLKRIRSHLVILYQNQIQTN